MVEFSPEHRDERPLAELTDTEWENHWLNYVDYMSAWNPGAEQEEQQRIKGKTEFRLWILSLLPVNGRERLEEHRKERTKPFIRNLQQSTRGIMGLPPLENMQDRATLQ